MSKVDLFDPRIEKLQDLFVAVADVDKQALQGAGFERTSLPIDIGTRRTEVRKRIGDLFENALRKGVGFKKVADPFFGESSDQPGKVTPHIGDSKFAGMIARTGKLVPEADDPDLEAAVVDACVYLGRIVTAAAYTQDGRGVVQLVKDLTRDVAAGVGLEKLAWKGTPDSPGRREVLAQRFYQPDGPRPAMEERITRAITYSRYRSLVEALGMQTELGRGFLSLVNLYYEKFKAAKPTERFKEKNNYMKEQWLGLLLERLIKLSTGLKGEWTTESWQLLSEWTRELQECETLDDLVEFINSFGAPTQQAQA